MTLTLRYDLSFADLYAPAGLQKLDAVFLSWLGASDVELAARLKAARQTPPTAKDETQLLLALGPQVDRFISHLFGIEKEAETLAASHHALAPLYRVKRLFVQRRAAKEVKPDEAALLDGPALFSAIGAPSDELAFATQIDAWQEDEAANKDKLDLAARYAAWALFAPEGRAKHGKGILFQVPKKTDPQNLVDFVRTAEGLISGHTHHARDRRGFDLTDSGTDLKGALDQANYCIWCAHQGKDSCSKGLRDKTSGAFLKNAAGTTQAGCPLEEKISEFHELKSAGHALAALAVICIDNPMAAATGHRICNDCMKACIYQKQQPVDIPQAETRTLKDVLALPWGFEIYSLLTRWNPLNVQRPVAALPNGKSVLVVGLGPAGYTLAHHLQNDGFHVLAIDGLKLEPLPAALLTQPIKDAQTLFEPLSKRVGKGFGGVAEYGITVRWDKNFLTLIRLLLERRATFAAAGGVRLGSTGTLSLDKAFELGFDHVALCMGAGKPTIVDMPHNLAPGVRQASDFLMALQLTGAGRADSLANLQLELPVVVIGGGLTAIDTATESLAYYPVQVEKFLTRYEALVATQGAEAVRKNWTPDEARLGDTFIAHATALRAAKDGAARRALLESWGGVTMAYRKDITSAPSYTLNHEEIALALEEGIHILDQATPLEVLVDATGHADGLKVAHPSGTRVLKARSILVAAGTQPNTVMVREPMGRVQLTLDGKYFQAIDTNGQPVAPQKVSKPDEVQIWAARHTDGRMVSFFGDQHPSFAGNVVKAMGSAKQGAPVIRALLADRAPQHANPAALLAATKADLTAHIVRVERLTGNIVEVVVKAPFAARQFQPGQFYRLQNFEAAAQLSHDTRMAMEGLALTGAWVDHNAGTIGLIVLEMGGSSSLCMALKPDEPVVLMGPTGAPTEIPDGGETVLLVGGGLGNAVLFSIGRACREKGNKVLYFAGYKKLADRYKVADIEAAADSIVWCCDEAPGFSPTRPTDYTFTGNMLEALVAYGAGKLGTPHLPLQSVDRMIVIGSDRLMGAIAVARQAALKPFLKAQHMAVGSINSPMQCMMKEICAQCLQRHVDPVTGKEEIVFSCFNQDQPLEKVDFDCLHDRLSQNSLSEKLTAAWIKHCQQA